MTDNEDSTLRESPSNFDHYQQRGHSNGQLLLGAFGLMILAGQLVTTGIGIQFNLAASPGVSWLAVAVITVLVVAGIAETVSGEALPPV